MLRNFRAERGAQVNRGDEYVVTYRHVDWPDGTSGVQGFTMPPETLALRAGEYGIDPADTQLLLDVVLHESFIVYPEDEHPLWTAPSIREAREHHLDIVADTRKEHEAWMKDAPRAKTYPGLEVHRTALVRTAELAPVYRGVVEAGRRMARRSWMELQSQGTVTRKLENRRETWVERMERATALTGRQS